MLFVPTNVERFGAKGPGVGADAIIVDLGEYGSPPTPRTMLAIRLAIGTSRYPTFASASRSGPPGANPWPMNNI